MRAVIQRVSSAAVEIDGQIKASIRGGLLILIGIVAEDTPMDIDWLVGKILKLRIFPDEKDIMNLSISDVHGDIIVVSQFTLHASTKKGNRPSYIRAAKPEKAIPLYEKFIDELEKGLGKKVGTGEFGAMMDIKLVNTGPVTIIIDSKSKD